MSTLHLAWAAAVGAFAPSRPEISVTGLWSGVYGGSEIEGHEHEWKDPNQECGSSTWPDNGRARRERPVGRLIAQGAEPANKRVARRVRPGAIDDAQWYEIGVDDELSAGARARITRSRR